MEPLLAQGPGIHVPSFCKTPNKSSINTPTVQQEFSPEEMELSMFAMCLWQCIDVYLHVYLHPFYNMYIYTYSGIETELPKLRWPYPGPGWEHTAKWAPQISLSPSHTQHSHTKGLERGHKLLLDVAKPKHKRPPVVLMAVQRPRNPASPHDHNNM
jgi:hypothetical protein